MLRRLQHANASDRDWVITSSATLSLCRAWVVSHPATVRSAQVLRDSLTRPSHGAGDFAWRARRPAMFSLAPVSVNLRDDTPRFVAYPKAYQRKQNDFWEASASDRVCRIACRLAFAMLPAKIKRLCRRAKVWRRDGLGNSDIIALR